jgi:hypothetical protein
MKKLIALFAFFVLMTAASFAGQSTVNVTVGVTCANNIVSVTPMTTPPSIALHEGGTQALTITWTVVGNGAHNPSTNIVNDPTATCGSWQASSTNYAGGSWSDGSCSASRTCTWTGTYVAGGTECSGTISFDITITE